MTSRSTLFDALAQADAHAWAQILPTCISQALEHSRHGNLPIWQQLIADLPVLDTDHRILNQDTVQIGSARDLNEKDHNVLESILQGFMPWRKGPFDLYGIHIDSEWRSDWKWQRLTKHISPLKNRLVLDVGSGNGYFCWRMLGDQARMVIGVDPLILNVMQFQLIRQLYGGEPPVYILPCGLEDLPANLSIFDTVFSMGVLYHRRSPIDHLLELKACLRPGGELILETLIIDGTLGEILVPEDRYANMRNVWFIPSCDTLVNWLKRCGFDNVRLVDTSITTLDEQRTTAWMTFQSLNSALDKNQAGKTVEGHPAPKRAMFIADTPKAN
jgi:tRNA (mo5U34)-methyltransferase